MIPAFLGTWIEYLPDLLGGLWISLQITALALGIGMPIGLLLAIGSASPRRALRWSTIAIVEIGRGTPALVVLQIMYFGLPSAGLTLTSYIAAVVALALTTAAYTSEIIRGGLQAVPAGEIEAAHALGMSRADTLRYIVIPQGLRIAIPPLMGFAILIFQATSLAYKIALPELMGRAYSIGSSTFKYVPILALAGLLYAVITIPAGWLTDYAERRMGRHL